MYTVIIVLLFLLVPIIFNKMKSKTKIPQLKMYSSNPRNRQNQHPFYTYITAYFPGLALGTSIKRGGVKLDLWIQTSYRSERMRSWVNLINHIKSTTFVLSRVIDVYFHILTI